MNNSEIESIFENFKECYSKISSAHKKETVHIKLGDELAQLHFSNPLLKDQMSRSLSHLINVESPFSIALTIYCFEGDVQPFNFVFPWTPIDFEAQGVICGMNTERFQCVYQHGSGAIIFFDNQRKEGIYYIQSRHHIPYWEVSFPFRTIFHWWTRDTPYQLLHSGGIGFSSSSMIISGKSGSGKSSTCLSSLLQKKLLMAGDDYVLVDTNRRILYSLYQCAKVEWDNLARLNFLNELTDKGFKEAEKAMIFIGEHLPKKMLLKSTLNFSLIPKVSRSSRTTIAEVSKVVSLKSVVPTSLFQLPLIREEAFKKCVTLIRELSAYEVLLGTNPQEIADVLCDFLETKSTS